MLGLVFKCFQGFVFQTYGAAAWRSVAGAADLDPSGFEAMLRYDPALAQPLVTAASQVLSKPPDTLLEDAGTFLVTDPSLERVRRLLRFGGSDFVDFLHSLDELPERARLALPDLSIPGIFVKDRPGNRVQIQIARDPDFFAPVLVGVVRAMADDYGALVLLDPLRRRKGFAVIDLTVASAAFAAGRAFELSGAIGAEVAV